MKTSFKISMLMTCLLFIINCSGGGMEESKIEYKEINSIPMEEWDQLGQKKIFFGHQSVGNNILEGIKGIMKENPEIELNIKEISDGSKLPEGVFAHTHIGKNEDPGAKIDAFVHFMENGLGNNADLAFFKFCFVDIDSKTDIQKLFDDYKSNMAQLKKKYPETTIIHFTVPLLRKNEPSFKQWIKGVFGKTGGFFANEHNVQRNKFNELIVKEYSGREPIFDLAGIESIYPDGSRETFTEEGETYHSLVPEYTKDGGHLNELGRKRGAEQLLLFLANLKNQN